MLGLATLAGCGNDGAGSPCAGVDCSGHGTCYTDGLWPLCSCEPGYRPSGAACVSDGDGGDSGGDGEDGDADHGGSCDPGGTDDRCAGGILLRCRTDGTGFVEIACPFGAVYGENVIEPLRGGSGGGAGGDTAGQAGAGGGAAAGTTAGGDGDGAAGSAAPAQGGVGGLAGANDGAAGSAGSTADGSVAASCDFAAGCSDTGGGGGGGGRIRINANSTDLAGTLSPAADTALATTGPVRTR